MTEAGMRAPAEHSRWMPTTADSRGHNEGILNETSERKILAVLSNWASVKHDFIQGTPYHRKVYGK